MAKCMHCGVPDGLLAGEGCPALSDGRPCVSTGDTAAMLVHAYGSNSAVDLLERARARLVTAGEMLLEEGAIEEDEDFEENVEFCDRLQAKIDALRAPHVIADQYAESDAAIHLFFGLTYASYLVLPRSVLQSMPPEWQRRMATLLAEGEELTGSLPGMPDHYTVNAHNSDGKFCRDPYRDYERGRRRVPLEPKP